MTYRLYFLLSAVCGCAAWLFLIAGVPLGGPRPKPGAWRIIRTTAHAHARERSLR